MLTRFDGFLLDVRGYIPYNIDVMRGGPPKAKALVAEFIRKYQKELEEMWETEKYIKLPPID